MKYLKMLGLLTAAAMSLMALAASSASALTLEVGGVTKNESVSISGSLQAETSGILSQTGGSIANTCLDMGGKGSTASPFTGETLGGSVSERWAKECTRAVTIHKDGTFKVEHITSTTNGTIISSGAEITAGTPFGTVNCKTNNTHMGVITGKKSGSATVDINAVVPCGFLLPSSKVEAIFVVTSPEALGIVA